MDRPRRDATSDSDIRCDLCEQTYRSRGFANHQRACEAKKIEAIQQQDHIDKAEIAKAKKSKS